GKEWVFTSIETVATAGEFEDYLAGCHRAEVHATCAGAPPAVYAAALAEVSGRIAGKHWRFGGPAMLTAIDDYTHMAKLLQLGLKAKHGAVSIPTVKRVIEACKVQVRDMLCVLNPNTFRPAA